MKKVFTIVVLAFLQTFHVNAQAVPEVGVDTAFKHVGEPEIIYYNSDSVKLKGYLYKPEGKGPFPVFMWNHDYEKDPDSNKQLASFWVKKGFIFFEPIRSGHSDNPRELYCCNRKSDKPQKRNDTGGFPPGLCAAQGSQQRCYCSLAMDKTTTLCRYK